MVTTEVHYLSSVSWRTSKASGMTQSKTEGLKTRGADEVTSSLRPKP